jgi:hypothetical protein
MKRTALGVLALAGTLVIQLASAVPSTAAERRVITKTVVKGQAVTAEFDHTDGCIQTRVSVFGSALTVRGSNAPEKLGFVSVTQVDTCTDTTLINGSGETSALNLSVPNALARGQLRMSIEFTNYADPANPVVSPMTADLSFRATARATSTFTKSKYFSEGIRFVSSTDVKNRAGSATGTVTLGAQKVVSPDTPAYYATMGVAISKDKTVARPV